MYTVFQKTRMEGKIENMKKMAVFFAEGYEEIEALTVVDICRRAGIQADMVSVTGEKLVEGAHGIRTETQQLLSETETDAYDMLVLPGGGGGTKGLEACMELMNILDSFYKKGKYIAAICAAPSIFGHRGFLRGRRACCYPGFESQLEGAFVTENEVETDGHVITGRSMGTAIPFALAVTEALCGREKAKALAEAIVYRK